MFTGMIETLGELAAARPVDNGLRLEVRPATPFAALVTGESIAVNGVCLTLEPGSQPDTLRFFLSRETLDKTTLGALRAGESLNLERALKVGSTLGGHMVSGHVDGVGTISRLEQEGESWLLEVSYPAGLAPMLAPKGSVCVDGISLTIVESSPARFSVAVIPQTIAVTRLRHLSAGSCVNLEVDPLARYVVHALSVLQPHPKGPISDLLQRAGFIQA